MKVLISNVYSPRNLGDWAIVSAMIALLEKRYHGAEITLMSRFYKDFPGGLRLRVVRDMVLVSPYSSWAGRLIRPLYDILRCSLWLMLLNIFGARATRLLPEEDPVRAVFDSDIVVAAGGGYLFSSNSFISRTLFVHMIHWLFAVAMGKRVILFPQTIGPIKRGYELRALIFVLKRVEAVMARDRESYNLLTRHGVKNVHLVPDIAFLWAAGEPSQGSGNGRRVLVTLLDWSWAIPDGPLSGAVSEYKEKMKEVIRFLMDGCGAEVEILPHVTVANDNDEAFSKEVSSEINDPRCRVTDKGDCLDVKGLLDRIQGFDMVIGSRMHSCVLGICGGVPTVGIGYQPKSRGMFELLGLGGYVFNATDLDTGSLKALVKKVLDSGEEERRRIRLVAKEASLMAMESAAKLLPGL